MKTTILTAMLAAAAIVPAARAAPAPGPTDAPQKAVFIGDLDLGLSHGATVALSRIRSAAGAVCGPPPLSRELAETYRQRACVEEATANAVRALNAPLVTARYYRFAPTRILAAR